MTAKDDVAVAIARARTRGLAVRVVADKVVVTPKSAVSYRQYEWLIERAPEVAAFLAAEEAGQQAPVPTAHGPPEAAAPITVSGLPPPHTTPTPDVFFDFLAPKLHEGELRVMLYLIRRTYGFKKEEDAVSLSQFCHGVRRKDGRVVDLGTGMSRRGVVQALAALEERGYVRVVRDSTGQRGHGVNLYRLVLTTDTPVSVG